MTAEGFNGSKGMNRPPQVENARHGRDTEALSAMGRKGAKATQRKRAIAREGNQLFDERRATERDREEYDRREQANENEYPPELYD